MVTSLTNIIGAKVVRQEDGQVLAVVFGLIIHPDTGKVEALKVKALDPRIRNAVVLAGDILEFKTKVYVNNENDVAEEEDIIRITDIISRNTPFFGNKVKNEAGEYIGKVYDLEFDTKSFYLKQIYTEKSFLIFKYNPRIFSYDSIIKAEPDYILVKDTQEVEEKAEARSILDKNQPVLDI